MGGAYTLPHAYLADGINDFSDEKDQIIPTPWYTFPGHLQKNMIGAAAIFFSGCTYQKKFDERESDEVRKRAAEKNLHDLKELHSQYSDGDILFNPRAYGEFKRAKEQLVATFIRETSNGLLYDATGSIDVFCFWDIPDGSYHAGAVAIYFPKKDGAIILDRVMSPEDFKRPKKEKRSLSDLVQEGLLLPHPA